MPRDYPENHLPLSHLGAAYYEGGDIQTAIGAYGEIIKINPSDGVSRRALGRLLEQNGNADAAIDICQRIRQFIP